MFILYGPHEDLLFSLGNGDLSICKQSRKNESSCQQNTFDYQEKKNVLIGREGEHNPFTVKRLQVWLLTQTDEQAKQTNKKLKQRKENQRKVLLDKESEYHNEINLLNKEHFLKNYIFLY